MEWLLSWLKPIDAPGSLPFLWLSIGLGLFLMFVWPRNRKWAVRWLGAIGVLYVILSLPLTAWTIGKALPGTQRVEHAPETGPLDNLIVFDGDNRRGRVNLAREAFRHAQSPEVWVLGVQSDWIQKELREAGVPWNSVHIDTSTGTTRAQVLWVAKRRRDQPYLRLAVIASRLQVPRTEGLARAAGLDVPILGAPTDREPPTDGLQLLVPQYRALRVSRDGLYEHAALRYYAWKGWIAP
jgi:uncharacterized SAM-binding protein YcdF (DUF218 family)